MFNNWYKKSKILVSVLLTISLLTSANTASVQAQSWTSPYITYVAKSNSSLPEKTTREIVVAAYRWASEFNLDPKLLLAVIKVESNFYPHAISNSGAYGLMQVIPVWHKEKIIKAREELGNPEIFNVNTNIYLGALVLRDCMRKSSRISKMLLCYSGQSHGYDEKVLTQYYNIQKL